MTRRHGLVSAVVLAVLAWIGTAPAFADLSGPGSPPPPPPPTRG
jgi:hypothetical protein